jgi:hypothetical protein
MRATILFRGFSCSILPNIGYSVSFHSFATATTYAPWILKMMALYVIDAAEGATAADSGGTTPTATGGGGTDVWWQQQHQKL